MSKLKINVALSTDRDPEPEVVVPLTVTLKPRVAEILGPALTVADLFDIEPGDGVFEIESSGRAVLDLPLIGRRSVPYRALASFEVEPS